MAVAEVPEELARLRDVPRARNVWWCWHDKAKAVHGAQPLAVGKLAQSLQMLEQASPERFRDLLENEDYMSMYREVVAKFDAYMAEPIRSLSEDVTPEAPIAYFSTEYGLNESIPIYSGGLGVLSGDHLKSASDMAIPLVAVGLCTKTATSGRI